MNKVDVLLNAIAQKHLQVEVLGLPRGARVSLQHLNNFRIRAALLAAFEGGVRHGANFQQGHPPRALIKEVDIDLGRLERSTSCA